MTKFLFGKVIPVAQPIHRSYQTTAQMQTYLSIDENPFFPEVNRGYRAAGQKGHGSCIIKHQKTHCPSQNIPPAQAGRIPPASPSPQLLLYLRFFLISGFLFSFAYASADLQLFFIPLLSSKVIP